MTGTGSIPGTRRGSPSLFDLNAGFVLAGMATTLLLVGGLPLAAAGAVRLAVAPNSVVVLSRGNRFAP